MRNNDLFVFHDDNSVLTEYTEESREYGKDPFVVNLSATQDYLYLGLYKPFDRVYSENLVANTVEGTFTAEYWNGSAWTAVVNFVDDSKHLTRSGFIKWDRDQDDWDSTTVSGKDLFWIRLRPSSDIESATLGVTTKTGNTTNQLEIEDADIATFSVGLKIKIKDTVNGDHFAEVTAVDTTATLANITFSPAAGIAVTDNTEIERQAELQGLNILFSDDNALRAEFRDIDQFRRVEDSSFVLAHEIARERMIQDIRNRGRRKRNTNRNFFSNTSQFLNITKWDILDAGEIAQAAKFMALAKIFFQLSDSPEDKNYQRYQDYLKQYGAAFDLYWFTIDDDDDGEIDNNERTQIRRLTINRL